MHVMVKVKDLHVVREALQPCDAKCFKDISTEVETLGMYMGVYIAPCMYMAIYMAPCMCLYGQLYSSLHASICPFM